MQILLVLLEIACQFGHMGRQPSTAQHLAVLSDAHTMVDGPIAGFVHVHIPTTFRQKKLIVIVKMSVLFPHLS